MNQIYFNGKILPENEAQIPVTDRSYLYGEGLFETFRSFNGKFPLLKEHLKRLEWSTTFLNLDFPNDIDFQEVCEELLERNAFKDARFKIILSQTKAKIHGDTVEGSENNVVIFCDLLETHNRPYKLKVVKNYVNDATPISTMKTTNYLVKVLGRLEAQDAGFDDGVLLNARGQVTEATTGNLFWLDEKGILKTVHESAGLLRGVMKQELLKLIKEKNMVCKEDVITPADLSNMREVFLTNSVVGIKPVSYVDHRQISGTEIGPVTQMLKELWEKHVKDLTGE